jgi:hypothetical protein
MSTTTPPKTKPRCQFAEGMADHCEKTSTCKWGDAWFCDEHGSRKGVTVAPATFDAMNKITHRVDECLAGKEHGNAIEYLARDLERELAAMEKQRDEARKDAERLAEVLRWADNVLLNMSFNAPRPEQEIAEKCRAWGLEALAAHEALTGGKKA